MATVSQIAASRRQDRKRQGGRGQEEGRSGDHTALFKTNAQPRRVRKTNCIRKENPIPRPQAG
eukprot:8177110-Pyramimonas_sp.AAC.1